MSDGKRPRVPLLAFRAAAVPVAGRPASAWRSRAPPGLPPGVYMGEPDYKQASAGTYALDPDHAAVIARVSHLGYSWSIFRFDRLSATLEWDPANTASSARCRPRSRRRRSPPTSRASASSWPATNS